MRAERVNAFVIQSHRRVIAHCDALLAHALDDAERERVLALRAAAEAEMRAWWDTPGPLAAAA